MGIIIAIFLIGIICYALGSGLEAIGKSSEEKRQRERQEKVNEYSSNLNEVKDSFEKELMQRYEDATKEFDFDTHNMNIIDQVSIYSPQKQREFEPQTIDIWKSNNSLYILTDKDYLNKQISIFKDNISEYVGIDFSTVKDKLINQYNTSERFLIHKYCIPIKDIEYFLLDGDIYTSTAISGGGGTVGGTSTKGAIIGGVLGGDAGAVIGSRKESVINEIHSNTIVHDEKYIIIKYRDLSNSLQEIRINKGYSEVYDILKILIPEKEYTYMIKSIGEHQNNVNDKNDVTERLSKLKELYENNLISEKEYIDKRNEIISML